MHKVHLDTDLGGDIDDLCALAMLLRWSKDIHLMGVTTVAEAVAVGRAGAFALDEQNEKKYGENREGLPSDIINFQHDPLAWAIALGWNEGVEIQELPLILEEKDGWLYERIHPSGKPTRVVKKVDGPRFNEFWFRTITSR